MASTLLPRASVTLCSPKLTQEPPTREAATAFPWAMASITTFGIPSHRLGRTKMSSFERKLKEETLGWRTCVAGGVDVSVVYGSQDHGIMMHKPYVHDLIEIIKPRLAARRASKDDLSLSFDPGTGPT